MVIEFISTPGAGKTTLLPAVTDYFKKKGLNAATVVDAARPAAGRTLAGKTICRLAPAALQRPLLWQVFYQASKVYRLKFFLKHDPLIRQVTAFQARRPITQADRSHVLTWFFHLVGYYEFLTAHLYPEDVLIFDEGFIHRVVQLFASENETIDESRVTAYLDLVPQPDLVIFPSASPEVCEQRVISRGVWARFQQKSRADLSRFILNSHQVVHLAVGHLKQKGWSVIEVNNEGENPSNAMAELHKELSKRSWISGPGPARASETQSAFLGDPSHMK